MSTFFKIKSSLIVSIICLSFTAHSNKNTNNQYDKEIQSYLDSIEVLVSDIPSWLSTVYDEESGGFYHNALMKNDPEGYEPDIQSTAMGLNILFSGNITSINEVSNHFLEKSKKYIFNKYDKETGLFLDPFYKDRVLESDRALGRSQGMALNALKKLNTDTKTYIKEVSIPEHLSSMSNFEKWFYSIKWEKTWAAFDRIGAQRAFIQRLPENLKDSVTKFIDTFAKESQDEDGFWGEDQPIEEKIGGAVKYAALCEGIGLTLPNPDLIYKTLIHWFRDINDYDFSETTVCPICVPRNAIALLHNIKPHLSFKMTSEEKLTVVRQTYEMLKFYKNADGGFMFNHTETRIYPLDIKYGYYDKQISDINGTHLTIDSRKSVYSILNMPVPKIEYNDRLLYFLK